MKFYRLAGRRVLFQNCGLVRVDNTPDGVVVAADMSSVKKALRTLATKLRKRELAYQFWVEEVTLTAPNLQNIMEAFRGCLGSVDSLIESIHKHPPVCWAPPPEQ